MERAAAGRLQLHLQTVNPFLCHHASHTLYAVQQLDFVKLRSHELFEAYFYDVMMLLYYQRSPYILG
jgi:hypothetical protein